MQPPTDQRFYRGSDRLLGGVCSGLAEGFHVDPLWARLAFVALAFAQGIGVLLYIVLWLLMPERLAGQAAGRSGLDSVGDDLKRAWTELRAQFSGSTTATSPAAPTETAAQPNPTPTTPPEGAPGTSSALAAVPFSTMSQNAWLPGVVLLVVGLVILANNIGFSDWGVVWPVALVALGILLLVRAVGRKT